MMKHQISVLGNDGKQYTIEEFGERQLGDAVGIIVQNEIMGLVMSFDEWEAKWGQTDKVVTEAQSECVALQTLSGKELSQCIFANQTQDDEPTANNLCVAYDRGNLEWYLPCLAELGMIAAYKDEINGVLSQLGVSEGDQLQDEWYWSSSGYSQFNAWSVYFSNGYCDYWSSKFDDGRVRACAAFSPLASRCEHPSGASEKASDLVEKTELTDEEIIAILRKRGYSGNITKSINI